ncbi:MAG: gliding motility protein GldM [Bacteroidales bacterium]|nr:gliding motility protein GldM [Bacteroidales bacterium]
MAGYKETPRQKMIAMMYLVLTALLALNVSKDMLEAFLVVNESMENTIEVFEHKLGNLYGEFEKQYQLKPQKVGDYWQKAQEARRLSNELKKYVEHMIFDVVRQSENKDSLTLIQDSFETKMMQDPDDPRKEIAVPMLNMSKVSTKDKYDESTNYFINRKQAEKLREKIEAYKTAMLNIVPPEFRGNIKMGLETEGPFFNADGNKQTWELHHFYHTILAASVTIMNKIKAEVQTAEFDIAAELFSEIDVSDFKFDKIEAKIIPTTNYVLQGDKYEAEVLVTAFDTRQTPEVFVLQGADEITISNKDRAQRVEGKDGIVRLSFPAGAVGLQKYAGVVEVVSPEGERIPYKFSGDYVVAPPSLTVAATKMNVFYIGVDNPVSISVPGIAEANLRASISVGTLTRDATGKSWIVRVPQGQKTVISVNADIMGTTRSMGSAEFRIRRVPSPNAEVAGQLEGAIDKSTLLAAGAIIPVMRDFEFELFFEVKSFRMTTIVGGDGISKRGNGNRFSEEMISMIQGARKGQKFFFENIQAEGPDKIPRSLNPISLEIK